MLKEANNENYMSYNDALILNVLNEREEIGAKKNKESLHNVTEIRS